MGDRTKANRKSYLKHRAKIVARRKVKRQENRLKDRIRLKRWRVANPERNREINKRSRQRQPEKERNRLRKWISENGVRHNAYQRNRYQICKWSNT